MAKDMDNRNLWFLESIIDKLENDIISRLSELAKPVRRGRINLENAKNQLKRVGMNDCSCEIEAYRDFVNCHRFEEKRNREISHKKFVLEWKDEKAPIHVPYKNLLRTIAFLLRAAKRIDLEVYGEIHSKFMWRELRGRRYTSTMLPFAEYMIAQHIRLPQSIRARIIEREIHEGKFHQKLLDVEVNGVNVQVYASKKWGAINLGGHLLILEHYPLQSITKIEGQNIIVDPAWKDSTKSDTDAPPNDL